MARVEIEERAWGDSKLKRLAMGLNLTPGLAMGILVTLWHDSQNENKAIATEEDLSLWFAGEVAMGLDPTRILAASGYIEKMADGRYRIDGNRHRLMKVEGYKNRAKHANDIRWQNIKKPRNRPKAQDESQDAARILNGAGNSCDKESQQQTTNSKQQDSMTAERDGVLRTPRTTGVAHLEDATSACEAPSLDQASPWDDVLEVPATEASGDPRQTNGVAPPAVAKGRRRRSAPPTPSDPSESKCGGRDLIVHFIEAYQGRYPNKPVIDGPSAGAAKRIVKALGLERARSFVDAFMRMDDGWFKTKRHTLRVLADNLDAVANFMATGVQVTGTTIRAEELTVHNRSVVEQHMQRVRHGA